MAKTKHTPPPWRFDYYSDNIYGSGITVARDIMVAGDTYLIAAAPDLLHALEALMMEINPPTPGSIGEIRINMVYAAAKAAIAKARGETA